jgi:CheY-like chemotaxis protein
MMDGEIWVESVPGEGSTFIFTLRLHRDDAASHALLLPHLNWRNLKILFVDDDKDTCLYFSDILMNMGISCHTAASGEDALALIGRNGEYNIYFVDWKMPGIDGIELSRRIKETPDAESVVIMISAADWDRVSDDAKAAGVDRFLSKPLFSSDIVDCINSCLHIDAYQEERDTQDEIDDFSNHQILLVEDVEINREIVLALLEPTRLRIDCATNGLEAVSAFRANPGKYEMIFMDLQMPVMDGLEASRQIRASGEPGAGTIPIIAMTANIFREDIEKCLDAGMNAHVGKPIAIEQVHEMLRTYLTQA